MTEHELAISLILASWVELATEQPQCALNLANAMVELMEDGNAKDREIGAAVLTHLFDLSPELSAVVESEVQDRLRIVADTATYRLPIIREIGRDNDC